MHGLTVSALVSALVVVTPNLIAVAEAQEQIEVSLAGIDTSNPQGADHALRRIRHAAEAVCDVRTGAQPVSERLQARTCVNAAVEKAVADLSDPVVTARYRGFRSYAGRGEPS